MIFLARVIATWFGCGLVPVGPGTAGAAGALLLAWLLSHFFSWPPWSFAVLAVVATPVGIWSATQTARFLGRKDPGSVVIDEVLGQWLTVAAAPSMDLPWLALAFGLFRLFDIWKPWPVRRLESLPEGTGIVVDDLAAGIYGALVMLLAGWFNSNRI